MQRTTQKNLKKNHNQKTTHRARTHAHAHTPAPHRKPRKPATRHNDEEKQLDDPQKKTQDTNNTSNHSDEKTTQYVYAILILS